MNIIKILRGESVEYIDRDFLADLASLGSKLMKKKKKRPSPYVKWFPGADPGGGGGGGQISC